MSVEFTSTVQDRTIHLSMRRRNRRFLFAVRNSEGTSGRDKKIVYFASNVKIAGNFFDIVPFVEQCITNFSVARYFFNIYNKNADYYRERREYVNAEEKMVCINCG